MSSELLTKLILESVQGITISQEIIIQMLAKKGIINKQDVIDSLEFAIKHVSEKYEGDPKNIVRQINHLAERLKHDFPGSPPSDPEH